MGRGTKTCLGCGLVTVLAACMLCVVISVAAPLAVTYLTSQMSAGTDPVKAKQIAAQIADYTLPAGHSEQAGVDLLLLHMVIIAPGNLDDTTSLTDGYAMMLLATKVPVDSAQLETQMREALLSQTQANGVTLQKVGERPVTIRGRVTTLSILEDNPDSPSIRAVSGSFQGKDGPTLVLIVSAAELWNWTTVEGFLGSIR